MDEQYISTTEAGAILGVTRDQIVDLIYAGRLVGVDVSTGEKKPHWRISRAALATFLRERTHKPTPCTAPRRRRRMPVPKVDYFPA